MFSPLSSSTKSPRFVSFEAPKIVLPSFTVNSRFSSHRLDSELLNCKFTAYVIASAGTFVVGLVTLSKSIFVGISILTLSALFFKKNVDAYKNIQLKDQIPKELFSDLNLCRESIKQILKTRLMVGAAKKLEIIPCTPEQFLDFTQYVKGIDQSLKQFLAKYKGVSKEILLIEKTLNLEDLLDLASNPSPFSETEITAFLHATYAKLSAIIK